MRNVRIGTLREKLILFLVLFLHVDCHRRTLSAIFMCPISDFQVPTLSPVLVLWHVFYGCGDAFRFQKWASNFFNDGLFFSMDFSEILFILLCEI